MSSNITRSLRKHLEVAASTCRVNYGEFVRSRGIKDFLLDAETRRGDAHDLVAFMLEYLVVGDKGKMDLAACVAAIEFLDEQFGEPQDDASKQRYRDLASLSRGSSSYAQYKLWAQGWYG